MLHLEPVTEPDWALRAVAELDTVLLDHAHLEKKAAAQALNLILAYPDVPSLMRPMSELAREELEHFEAVLEQLERRGVKFLPQRPAPYAQKLRTLVRRQEPGRLLDIMLCSAVIEARSCERMGLLRAELNDPALSQLYRGLLAAEARHHLLYLELAEALYPAAEVAARLKEVTEHEAQVLREAPREPRFHSR